MKLSSSVLVLSLVISLVDCISIDGQLTVIKNDCYERMSIGEKLSPKQTYKTVEHKTITKCEMECTEEKDRCRAYSFGIGPKGNATCLLSRNPIKETADLKPIGTISDTDYDLYIKKIDCQVVFSTPQKQPPNNNEQHGISPTQTNYHGDSSIQGYVYQKPHYGDSSNVEGGGYIYKKPTIKGTYFSEADKVQQVQTLVSVASGPQTILHPVHDIIVSENAFQQQQDKPGGYGDRPPFRPSVLNHPYKDHKQGEYDSPYYRPENFEIGYGDEQFKNKPYLNPHYGPKFPDIYGQITIDKRKYESSYFQSEIHKPNYNYHYNRPDNENYLNRYASGITRPDDYVGPDSHYDYLFVRPNGEATYSEADYDRKSVNIGGYSRFSENDRKKLANDGYDRPLGHEEPSRIPTTTSSSRPASTEQTNPYDGLNHNKQFANRDQAIVTESVGYHGEKITSIITPLKSDACFRRTMAGKRVVRGLVRKLLICDTVEQCQRECGDERQFTCEGFNYRLDPTGRGKGECELIDLPLLRIDLVRETVRDPDYDFYVRDRNAAQDNCRQPPSSGNSFYGSYDYDSGNNNRRGDGLRTPYDRRPIDTGPLRRPLDRWDGDYEDRRPPPPEGGQRSYYGNRRGDYSYHHSHESHSTSYHDHYNEHSLDRIYDHHPHQNKPPISGSHYLPASSYDDRFIPPSHQKKYPVIIPLDDPGYPNKYPLPTNPGHWPKLDLYGDKYRHGFNRHNNYYIPPKPPKPDILDDWGRYGGSYGTGLALEYQGYHNKQTYNYWGFNKFENDKRNNYGSDLPPRRYLPTEKPHSSNNNNNGYDLDNNIFPLEPRRPPNFDFIRDECSLRSATGFRLHKGIVKKFLSVPNIYECEFLCVKEKEFPCTSYAFRYVLNANVYNCYLSNKNYKELDYYTDLEPDKDFDIYTMNNRQRCEEPIILLERQNSDCFWRVRSGQRLHHSIVRDSLSVKNIVDCQLECLKSKRFTCRAYSFRYGSPVIGGAIDNCQLTDWPFYELDQKIHFVPELDFEVYERGSYGHGCEPDHFGIRGKIPPPVRNNEKVDQLCYVGFGSAAKLLPRATVKSLFVPTELDCKEECSKARESIAFRCMSFSFINDAPKIGHNCFLSDIMQRDLLLNIDYVHDPNSWLFTWDNYNPKCIELTHKPLPVDNFANNDNNILREIGYVEKYGFDYVKPLDVWRVYSVSGWPCKRGALCKENHEVGFWYCELEGTENDAWDYCCSPDHHCGFSNGYPYSWCYVGPSKTQWRKCNDQYYPYIHNVLDRFDSDNSKPWQIFGHAPPAPQTSGYRPDRPNAPAKPLITKPTLDEYEKQFDNEFLNPPKPGGFGQPRRWPVAYLHKEMPPNATRIEKSSENNKLSAIKSLIDVIRNTEIQNVQYQILNDSTSKNKADDVLYVKIPLPKLDDGSDNNTTTTQKPLNELSSNTSVNFDIVHKIRTQKSLPLRQSLPEASTQTLFSSKNPTAYRRGFVTRTNMSDIRSFRSF